MTATISRLIPHVVPVNPNADRPVRQAQAALDRGMAEAVNALLHVGPSFALDRGQCEHIARLVLLHTLYAVEDGNVPTLLAALVDRLNREHWLSDGGAR